MVEILLLTLGVLLPLLLVMAAGAVDLVRREVSFGPGLGALGLAGLLQMLAGGCSCTTGSRATSAGCS